MTFLIGETKCLILLTIVVPEATCSVAKQTCNPLSYMSSLFIICSSKGGVFSLDECDVDDFEMPPKKRVSIHSEESCAEQQVSSFFNLPGMKAESRHNDVPVTMNRTRQGSIGHSAKHNLNLSGGNRSSAHSGYPTSPPLPTMSKLTMNIGYSKHLATNTTAQDKNHTAGEAVLEPSQYTSFNLLSNKRLLNPAAHSDAASTISGEASETFSFQQAQCEMRASLSQSNSVDYPIQTPQLNSMYNNSSNSSSISDFKLLMAQTSASDFSNWNDGSIWQPRAISHSSTSSLFSEDESYQQSHDYDENFDEIPSFDEAMDIMMASK